MDSDIRWTGVTWKTCDEHDGMKLQRMACINTYYSTFSLDPWRGVLLSKTVKLIWSSFPFTKLQWLTSFPPWRETTVLKPFLLIGSLNLPLAVYEPMVGVALSSYQLFLYIFFKDVVKRVKWKKKRKTKYGGSVHAFIDPFISAWAKLFLWGAS